jgi:predicted nuclease of predicted toxin-antitoxin system
MKILVDMNLSPLWVDFLADHGFEAIHWSKVGDPGALDSEIFSWACSREYVIFTNDLDFSAILAAAPPDLIPSVVQIRTADLAPDRVGSKVLAALNTIGSSLMEGGVVSIKDKKARFRSWPFVDEQVSG